MDGGSGAACLSKGDGSGLGAACCCVGATVGTGWSGAAGGFAAGAFCTSAGGEIGAEARFGSLPVCTSMYQSAPPAMNSSARWLRL